MYVCGVYMYLCVCICMCICIHVHMCTCEYMVCVCMLCLCVLYMCVCMYICMCVCLCVCVWCACMCVCVRVPLSPYVDEDKRLIQISSSVDLYFIGFLRFVLGQNKMKINSKSFLKIYFCFLCMNGFCLHVFRCITCMQPPQKPAEGFGPPGTRVPMGSLWVLGTESESSPRVISALNSWAISPPTPKHILSQYLPLTLKIFNPARQAGQ